MKLEDWPYMSQLNKILVNIKKKRYLVGVVKMEINLVKQELQNKKHYTVSKHQHWHHLYWIVYHYKI